MLYAYSWAQTALTDVCVCVCVYPIYVGYKNRTRRYGVPAKLTNTCINAFVYRLASDKPGTAGTYVGVP